MHLRAQNFCTWFLMNCCDYVPRFIRINNTNYALIYLSPKTSHLFIAAKCDASSLGRDHLKGVSSASHLVIIIIIIIHLVRSATLFIHCNIGNTVALNLRLLFYELSSSTLQHEQIMYSGEYITSANCLYVAHLQCDGDLVVRSHDRIVFTRGCGQEVSPSVSQSFQLNQSFQSTSQ